MTMHVCVSVSVRTHRNYACFTLKDMKRREHNEDKNKAFQTKDESLASQRLSKKRRLSAPDEIKNKEDYRTSKRQWIEKSPENSPSASSDSDDSSSSSNSSSNWSSWSSEDSIPTEMPGENLANVTSDAEDLRKTKEEETVVLKNLDNFWFSLPAGDARKQLQTTRTQVSQNACSLETLRKRCGNVEKLMELPCVLSVGYCKEDSKFRVFVTDPSKALELSKDLASPNIELVEARSSYLM
ncbi:uncharacterized protein LOC114541435 isoform X3 [Dendronephthya gigantea]|uniref:uncharacterized protein LOC114541435 isoform X3 n=1 Tax=Dendronephthya gigantea TaxID=151771 RepID=UPI00106C9355|nr:uncharacterized protein LOC114541435 isoform X3 [Dendronephthya gigantea]